MPNGFDILTEEDWENATQEQKELWTFRTLSSMNERLKKLEKKGMFDKGCAFAGGVVGGICSTLGIKFGIKM